MEQQYRYKIGNLEFATPLEAYEYASNWIYINPAAKETIIENLAIGEDVTVSYGFSSITIHAEAL